MEIYIFRHGQTDWNAVHKIQGHTDIPLNEVGRKEAELLKERLSPLSIEKVFSSDLSRAKETASIALGHLEVIYSDRLREAFFGEAEGKVFNDVIKEYGEEYFKVEKKYWDIKIAGAESKRECIERIWNYIDEEIRPSGLRRVAISTHGGVIRNIVHSILPEGTPKIAIPNCCVYQINLENEVWVPKGLL